MNVRELPWTHGRFFEVDSWNAILQPNEDYVYFILTCHCPHHATPHSHITDAAKIFISDGKMPLFTSLHNTKWIHVIQNNPKGYTFYNNIRPRSTPQDTCYVTR